MARFAFSFISVPKGLSDMLGRQAAQGQKAAKDSGSNLLVKFKVQRCLGQDMGTAVSETQLPLPGCARFLLATHFEALGSLGADCGCSRPSGYTLRPEDNLR